MTPKQEAFVREYLIDLDAAKAVERAGYHAKGQRAAEIGYQLLQKTPVKAQIQEKMDERAQRTQITSDYVLETIRDTVERCRQRVPVMVGQGKERKQAQEYMEDPETGEITLASVWAFDAANVLRGAELLGKHLKLFTDKTEVSGPDGGPVTLNIQPVKAANNDSPIKNVTEVKIIPR